MTVQVLPLSLSQQQVWLDQQSFPDSPHFNIGGIGWLDGSVDIDLFAQALEYMVAEAQTLRLLPQTNGELQLLDDWSEPLLTHKDFSSDNNPEKAIADWGQALFDSPVTLDGQTRPWEMALLKQDDNRFALIARFHHLIFDGYSVALAFRRWSSIYNALLEGRSPDEDKPLYSQFIEESQHYDGSDSMAKDKAYWLELIPQLPQPLLAADIGLAKTALPKAQHHYFMVEREQYGLFQSYAKNLRATAFHLYLAALAIYFCRINGKTDILFGLPVLNRSGKRYKETLGMFVGMIPFKVDISEFSTVPALVGDINKNLKRAYRHARYPLGHLGRDLDMLNHGQDRLFDIVLSFEIQDFTVMLGDAPLTKIRQFFSSTARYPLSLSVCEFHDDEPVEIAMESSAAHFSMAQTVIIGQRLHYLMQQMVTTENASIATLPLLLPAERHEMLYGKHLDVPEYPNPQPTTCQFEHQAALTPNACAVRTLNSQMSYAELNQQANRLARKLIELGVQPEAIIAVVMPRKIETLVAYLAANKARAAFAPIDPDAPIERIMQLIELSGAAVVLAGENSDKWRGALPIPTIDIDCPAAPQFDHTVEDSNLTAKPTADDLIYLLFTSGSTGTPKGVLMEHGPLSRRLSWLGRTFKFSAQDTWLQSIQLTFDPAMLELFLPLIRGGTVALAPPGQVPPLELPSLAEALEATCMIFVPTTLRYFNQAAEHHPDLKLRVAISGGETLPRDLARTFNRLTGADIYNFYGPTEACIQATAHEFESSSLDDPVPIGLPIDDTRIYILDDNQQPLPPGACGELYIGGKGLARGYLNNTQAGKRFLPDPFMPGLRMYATGDNAYYDDNGHLCFVGRLDNQIKLRGQRIEPAEIEAALCECPFVKTAAVKKHDNALHAWLVLSQKADEVLLGKLRKALKGKLPAHMQPNHFTILTKLPQQSSGKTDYRQLSPAPFEPAQSTQTLAKEQGNDLEVLLCNLWLEVLPGNTNGLDCDFFTSGGDSLKALQLLEIIRKQMGQRLPLSMLLHNPTPRKLAQALIERHHPIMVKLSKHNFGTPVYLCASGHGDAVRFMPLVKALGSNYHLLMLQPPELEGYTTYHTMGELAQYYADLIEQQHHNTPPVIAGFSVAGVSALETARRLVSQGITIKGLVMIDTTYPKRLVNRPILWRLCRWLVNSLHIEHLSLNNRTLGSLFNDPGLNGQIFAIRGYRAAPLSLPVSLIISSGFNRWYRLLFKPWKKLFGKHLEEVHLNGFHGTLFSPEHVDGVAKVLRKTKRSPK